MAKYGHYRRANKRLNVLRGYTGNEPQSLTRTAKPKANEGILSGQLISIDSNGEWVKGVPTGKMPYFAYHDQSDTDVVSSGLLLGLSCAGDFEIETSHIDAAGVYNDDTPLAAMTAGDVGKITPTTFAATGNDIIGFVSRKGTGNNGRHDVSKIDSQFGTVAGPNYTVILTTRWTPSNAV
jgi:hypothetical protein